MTKENGMPNEGEGSTSGAKAFDDAQEKFARSGKVDDAARKAEQALGGKEGAELEKARRDTAAHSRGEDPALKEKAGKA